MTPIPLASRSEMSGDEVRQCAVCHKNATEVPLLLCERCKVLQYYSKACQKSDWPTHKPRCKALQKPSCKAPNYVLKVRLLPNEIKNPSVTRTLSCPASASFLDLHKALQISFGWASTHLFEFRLKPPGSAFVPFADLSRSLAPNLLSIDDDEQEDFEKTLFPDIRSQLAPSVKASKFRIGEILADKKYTNARIEYEYDFLNAWEHEIVVVERQTATDNFFCVAGEGHGVAEDVNEFTGWEELKEAYRVAEPTDKQQKLKHWYENDASNRDTLGLGGGREWIWDPASVNAALGRLRL